jgi:hypothetical protein
MSRENAVARICAIALGTPTNDIVGSGLLIGPDLVITNFHVLETFLQTDREPCAPPPAPCSPRRKSPVRIGIRYADGVEATEGLLHEQLVDDANRRT